VTSWEVCGRNLPSSKYLLLWDSTKRIKENLKLAVNTVGGPADIGREDFSSTSRSGTVCAILLNPHIVTAQPVLFVNCHN